MAPEAIPGELADLLERAARHPEGWDLVREASLECAAMSLGVHPFVLEAARVYFQSPEGGDCLARVSAHPAPAGDALPAVSGYGEDSDEARALIRAAAGRARGLEAVQSGAVDEVAADFGVHPYIVLRARGALERYPYRHPE